MLVILTLIAVFLCVIHLVVNYNGTARTIKKIPGPKDWFIVGNALELDPSPVGLFKLGRKFANQFNGIYRIWAYPAIAVNIYNPEDIESVTSTTKNINKSIVYKFLTPWLQEGLLVSKGAKWQQRRKLLTPTFHFTILRQFIDILEENSQRLVEILKETQGKSTDVVPIISEYTLNSICETAMGTQLHKEAEGGKSYKDSIYKLGHLMVTRLVTVYLFWDCIFNLTSLSRQQTQHLKVLHNFTNKVIEERKRYTERNGMSCEISKACTDGEEVTYRVKKKTAMLDWLISAEKAGSIDRAGIQEEVDTFMFEGHDTTASGLTFCLMAIANYKHVQDKIVEELQSIFGESPRSATTEDLASMKYMECCIKESLRLYPPVPFISRDINETIQLSNFTVPQGTTCHIHIYDLHRRPDLYKNPLVFDPDRFLPENSWRRHPYAYIPFSAGPRNCIGQKFAMMEMKSCISAILRTFELVPVTRDCDCEYTSDLVLRTTHPINVKFVERNKKQ